MPHEEKPKNEASEQIGEKAIKAQLERIGGERLKITEDPGEALNTLFNPELVTAEAKEAAMGKFHTLIDMYINRFNKLKNKEKKFDEAQNAAKDLKETIGMLKELEIHLKYKTDPKSKIDLQEKIEDLKVAKGKLKDLNKLKSDLKGDIGLDKIFVENSLSNLARKVKTFLKMHKNN